MDSTSMRRNVDMNEVHELSARLQPLLRSSGPAPDLVSIAAAILIVKYHYKPQSACARAGGGQHCLNAGRVSRLADRVTVLLAKMTATPMVQQISPRVSLDRAAAQHGLRMHDVPADNRCQFHALLDAAAQLTPSRATEYDVDSLRVYLLQTLDKDELLGRMWISAGDSDATSVCNLRETLEVHCCSGKTKRFFPLCCCRMRQDFRQPDYMRLHSQPWWDRARHMFKWHWRLAA